MSADGTNGDFPSDNTVTGNHFHENGVLTKQSSPYFQTIACHNNITDNVMYNGPRAGYVCFVLYAPCCGLVLYMFPVLYAPCCTSRAVCRCRHQLCTADCPSH